MARSNADAPPAAACALACVLAGNGRLSVQELQALERLNAFQALGVNRSRFEALVQQQVAWLGAAAQEHAWLAAAVEADFNAVLDAVSDTGQRALVVHLARAACDSQAPASRDVQLLLEHMMVRWRLPQAAGPEGEAAPGQEPAA